MNHNNYSGNLINCTMDQPIQVLMDKLSSKSSQLYIFWVKIYIYRIIQQNYNQLYNLYQQKTTEIVHLRQQIVTLRRQSNQKSKSYQDEAFFKQRYIVLERNLNDQKLEVNLFITFIVQSQKLKNQCKSLNKQTTKYHEENLQLQTLLQQLRDQNNLQRQSIEKILNQLKSAQNQLSTYSKLYDQVQQKQYQITKLIQNQKKLNQIILEREDQIQELIESGRETKIHYENLLRQSMQNAKTKVIQSLPNLIKTSKQKVQIIAN